MSFPFLNWITERTYLEINLFNVREDLKVEIVILLQQLLITFLKSNIDPTSFAGSTITSH